MAKFPTYEEMAQEVAQRAIDECEYEGKTLREWIEIITAQHGTNLAEAGTDCISRQAAIDYFVTNVGFHDEDGYPIEDECELRKIWTGYFDGIPSEEPEKRTDKRTETHACDSISRQAAIDAILGQPSEPHYPSWYAEQIKELPSAQPDIIRCKDCKNWDTTWTNDFSPNYHYCPMVDGSRKEDWFCADAERRTDG